MTGSVIEQAKRSFQLVVAATRNLGIGQNGSMPWKLPGDMAYFRDLTSKTRDPTKLNAVIMGRKTWESIPAKFRPLKGRLNVVLSRTIGNEENATPNTASAGRIPEGVQYSASLDSAITLLSSPEYQDKLEHVFIIGGGQVYNEAIESELCSTIHLTRIEADFDCDTFFPAIPERFRSACPHLACGYLKQLRSSCVHKQDALFYLCTSGRAQHVKHRHVALVKRRRAHKAPFAS